MAKFSDLSLRAQRELMEEYRNNGINDLSDMIADYDREESSDTTSSGTSVSVPFSLAETYRNGGKIHIKPENRGKFTALKKRTGHSASWFKAHGTPAQKKMAVFALNSKHWSHKRADGGYLDDRDLIGPPAPRTPAGEMMDFEEMKRRQRYAESTFRDDLTSPAGAVGRYQVMPVTAKEYEECTGNKGDLLNPEFNEGLRDWYMNKNLKRYNAIKRGNPTPYIDQYRRYAAYNMGPVGLNKILSKAEAEGIDIDTTTDWVKYLPKETQDYVNFIVGGKDIPDTSKTNAEYRRTGKKYNIFASGSPGETVLPEEFAYTPEIQDEIVATPKINLSKGWRFNRGYYNDMVQNIIAGNDPLINRENYNDIYFSGKRRAGRKLKKAIAKADAKQTKLDNEAWQEQQQKQYRDYIINGLRNNTLTPEEFGNYTSYGIDRYGVPIAVPIVGAAVAGAAAPAFSALRGVGKFVPKAMDYTFNPVGAALRTGVEGATKLGASTVAGMSVPTASMVATGTDIGMMSVYGAKAAQEMKERGITPENATSFGMSVIPAFGVPIAAGYKYVKPLIDGMPSLRSAFTSSAKVGGNGITPWRSYMARQVLNPDSLYSKVNPEKFLKWNAAKKRTLADRANAASDAAAMTSNAQYDLITNMNKAPTDARGMWLHTKREMPAQLLNNDMMYTFPVKPLGDPVAVSDGTVLTPLTYTTSQGNTVSVQVPAYQGAFTEARSTAGINFFPKGYDYASGTFPLTSSYKVKTAVTGSPSSLIMNSSASKPLVEAVKNDFDMLQNAAGDSGLVIGSGVVAKRYGITSPGDADFVATRKTADELKRKLGFKFDKLNAANGDKGTMKYSINGNNAIDIDYIEGNDTESWGTLAEQFYQYLHPEEYVRLRNQRAFSQLGGKSTTDFHLPISPEALLAEVKNDPNALLFRTLMDNIGSGKVKHINRIKSLIDFAPEQLSEVTRIYSRGLFGREVPVTETYPNMRFDDVAANEDFLQALGLPKSWAKSPEKVKAATSLLDFSLNTVTSGKGRRGDVKTISDLERFIDSGTSATNAAGPGANTVTAANYGGGASYAASGANTVHRVNATYNPEEIETPAQLLRKMQTQVATDTDVFIGYSPDKLKKAHDILQKYGIVDDLESVTTQEQLYFELNDAQDRLNASLGYEKASEVLKEVTKALDIPAVRSATEYINTDSFITEAGGYVGSFSAGKSPEGELIYGANVPGGKLETPKLFTNKDLLPKTDSTSPKLQMRHVTVDDPAKAAEAYRAAYPSASEKEISDFEAVVADTENYIKTYLEEAKKAAEELEAAGFPEKYGLSGGYDKLSPMAKQIMDISMVDDHFSPKVLAEAFKDMDKIKDLQKRAEDISKRRDFLWKLVHERAALTVPYNHNAVERSNVLSYSLLATLAGMLGYGAEAGIRGALDRNYHKDSEYNKFVSYSFPEFPSGAEIPWSEYTADNRKNFDEKYKDELKAYNRATSDVLKQRKSIVRGAKKDYASINRALREYEKNKKRR